jgi:hypothetical protein
MPVMLVDEDPPDIVIVIVPLIDVVLAFMDALAASGSTTFSYAEQLPFGASEQLSCCRQ